MVDLGIGSWINRQLCRLPADSVVGKLQRNNGYCGEEAQTASINSNSTTWGKGEDKQLLCLEGQTTAPGCLQ
jgi:hypothetical protein